MAIDTPAIRPAAPRTRAAAVTLWLLAAAVVLMLVLQLIVGALMPPIGFLQGVILAVPLVMIARRVRGGFVTTAVLVALLLLASAGPIVEDLSTPSRLPTFLWTAIALPELLATLVAAVLGAVTAHRVRRGSVGGPARRS